MPSTPALGSPSRSPAPLAGAASLGAQIFGFVFFAALAVVVAFQQGPIIVAGLKFVYGDPRHAPAAVLQNLTLVSPVFPLALGVVAFAWLAWRGGGIWPALGFQRRTWVRDLAFGLAGGVVALGVAVLCLRLLALRFALPPLAQFPWHYHLYFATVGAVIPGVAEEVYFRGLLFRIAPRVPAGVLLVLGAAAFALWHVGTPVYLLHTFLLGLIFGTLTLQAGRLAPAIIAHITANAGFGGLLLAGFDLSP